MALLHPFKLTIVCVTAAVLSACSGAQNLSSAIASCKTGSANHVEVYIPDARVIRVLGERGSRSGVHEGFIIAGGILVEDNVDITGPIPLHRGDIVSLLGQFECDDNVIHWTHHDPRGRHPSGYVKVNGRMYE